MSARILLVEDEPDIAAALAEHLRIEGYEVQVAGDGHAAVSAVTRERPDLVILDLMLPDIPGEVVLGQVRAQGFAGPVLILSARQGEVDKVRGFRLGADDFVTKPFSLLELLARVDALLRRSSQGSVSRAVVTHGPLRFDRGSLRVSRDGEEIALRPKERDLLFMLLAHAGQLVTRERLLGEVWGYSPDVDTRTLDWHVAELRRKLGDDRAAPRIIRTVRKSGYELVIDGAVP